MTTTADRARPRAAVLTGLLALLLAACSMDSADTPPDAATPDGVRPDGAAAADSTLIGAVFWMTDYDAAVARGLADDKPLWVHFGEDPG